MKALLIPVAVLALSGCGSSGGTKPDAPADGFTPASIAIPLADEATFRAEFGWSVGDYVVNCFNGSHTTISTVPYPNDGTVQLADGSWVQVADLIQDGFSYSCGAQ